MLAEILAQCAEQCERENVAIDGEPNGAVCLWVRANVKYRPETEFFVVTLLTAELADREARRQGFASQGERAATLAAKKFN
jgi:hypothetical protein